MNIRTVGHLDRYLARSMAWRKKELTAMKFAVDTAPAAEQRVLLRAAATLLYAHWEGFVKEAGTCYLQLVARQALSLGELTPTFIAVSLGPQIQLCGRSKKVSMHKSLVERMTSGMALPAKLGWRGVVKTRSNLKSEVFREIVQTLDLDFAPFELKAKPVIDKLVEARNGIAHGEGLLVDQAEYDNLHSEIIALLQEFKTQLEIAAATRKYKK